jgi:hypothetical protein
MSKVVPSQVISFIDSVWPAVPPDMPVYAVDAAILLSIIDLVDDIPVELLTISGDDYTDLVFSLESLGQAVDHWNQRGTDNPPRTLRQKSPVYLLREALKKCRDEYPSFETTELIFVDDDALRNSVRLDISGSSNALHRNDFKAATVLAGAAIEALLLWALQSKGITAPLPDMTTKPKDAPDNWFLHQFIEAAQKLDFLKTETVTQTKQAQNFRNLIHPGRVQRKAQSCDRGTALAAMSTVELVARDLAVTCGNKRSK